MFATKFENWEDLQIDLVLQDTRKMWGIQHFKEKHEQVFIAAY